MTLTPQLKKVGADGAQTWLPTPPSKRLQNQLAAGSRQKPGFKASQQLCLTTINPQLPTNRTQSILQKSLLQEVHAAIRPHCHSN